MLWDNVIFTTCYLTNHSKREPWRDGKIVIVIIASNCGNSLLQSKVKLHIINSIWSDPSSEPCIGEGFMHRTLFLSYKSFPIVKFLMVFPYDLIYYFPPKISQVFVCPFLLAEISCHL